MHLAVKLCSNEIFQFLTEGATKPANMYPLNGPLSGTTWVSRYQKGKTNLDFTEARESEWQWHQLGHMQHLTPDRSLRQHPTTQYTG